MKLSKVNGRGDKSAVEDKPLEEAFARDQDALYGMLFFLLGRPSEAEEALRETFIKCWRHRRSAQDHVDVRSWLFRVALNVGRSMRGSHRRHPGSSRDSAPRSDPPSAFNGYEGQSQAGGEPLARLRQAIWQLRLQEQEVFLLRQNGQMSYDEIGQIVGSPVEMVRTRMRLALRKIREALN